MEIQISAAIAALTADGDDQGYVTVADNGPFYPGTIVHVYSTTTAGVRCEITQLSGATKIRLRILPAIGKGPIYTMSPMSAYKVAEGAYIACEAQLAPVQSIGPVVKVPSA